MTFISIAKLAAALNRPEIWLLKEVHQDLELHLVSIMARADTSELIKP